MLGSEIAVRTRDLLRKILEGPEEVIVQGSIGPDHVHMLVSVRPHSAPSKLVRYLKGRSSRLLQDEFPAIAKAVLGGGNSSASLKTALDREPIRQLLVANRRLSQSQSDLAALSRESFSC